MKKEFKKLYFSYQDNILIVIVNRILIKIGISISFFSSFLKRDEIFFFFPNYYLTGSNKVNLDILKAVQELKPAVVMCGQSKDKFFYDDFKKYSGRFFDISKWTSNPTIRYLMYGYWSGILNRRKEHTVFFGSGKLFYEFLEYLDSDIKVIDLIHALDKDNRKYFFEQIEKIDRRIIINHETKKQMIEEYEKRGFSKGYQNRLQVIYNGVDVPPYIEKRKRSPLKLLFVGRESPVKRVYLAGRIATECKKRDISAEVVLVGDVEHVVDEADRKNCIFVGSSSDVSGYYRDADLLLITSSQEGFPLVVMEAMAYGVVPLCTDVGGMRDHICGGENGFLIENYGDEREIVREFVDIVLELTKDGQARRKISRNAYDYAKEHFSRERFKEEYNTLFSSFQGQ